MQHCLLLLWLLLFCYIVVVFVFAFLFLSKSVTSIVMKLLLHAHTNQAILGFPCRLVFFFVFFSLFYHVNWYAVTPVLFYIEIKVTNVACYYISV